MAITVSIYSESEETTRRVTLDFVSNILASSSQAATGETDYYFTMTTTSRDGSGNAIPVKVMQNLSLDPDGSPAAYTDVTEMVRDYIAWFAANIDFSA